MDHDDATIGHIYSRREALALAASAGVSLVLSSSAFALIPTSPQQGSGTLVASPVLTEGPFFVDGKLDRSNLLGKTTRKAVTEGKLFHVEVRVLKLVGSEYKPLDGAQVDLWHADAIGVYSDVDHPMNNEKTAGQDWLRGFQKTDTKGVAKFETIVPGWYMGRALHIHFKIRKHDAASNKTAELSSQMFFADSDFTELSTTAPYSENRAPRTLNTRDGIFNERIEDGSKAGNHLLLKIEKVKDRYKAVFTIVLTDKNFGEDELDWSSF
jgi:protocatechuate 3,4-dioxygenase beta subunit